MLIILTSHLCNYLLHWESGALWCEWLSNQKDRLSPYFSLSWHVYKTVISNQLLNMSMIIVSIQKRSTPKYWHKTLCAILAWTSPDTKWRETTSTKHALHLLSPIVHMAQARASLMLFLTNERIVMLKEEFTRRSRNWAIDTGANTLQQLCDWKYLQRT